MVNQETIKAVFLCGLFVLLFSTTFKQYAGGGDYDFHREKALNGCENMGESCEMYAPLLSFIAAPFAFHENAFFYFVVFLMAFVTPMLLYAISRKWVVVWFYFSCTSYYWFFVDGIFAQATAMILLLLVVYFKDWRLQALMVLLAITAHGHGFLLCLIAFVLLNFEKIGSNIWLGCSGVFGRNPPEILNQPVGDLTTMGVQFRVADGLILFTKIFPLPLFLVCGWFVWYHRRYVGLFLIALASIVSGFLYSHRMFYVVPIVCLPILVEWFYGLDENYRRWFLLVTLVLFGFQLYSWFNFKLVCA